MKAWIIETFDGIDKMRLTEVADPTPAPGEVLLRVSYAALNPADRYLAAGEYPAKPPLPHILGRDGSGVIAVAAAGVEGHPVGQKRAILRGENGVSRWGTFAELVTGNYFDVLGVRAARGRTFLPDEDAARANGGSPPQGSGQAGIAASTAAMRRSVAASAASVWR